MLKRLSSGKPTSSSHEAEPVLVRGHLVYIVIPCLTLTLGLMAFATVAFAWDRKVAATTFWTGFLLFAPMFSYWMLQRWRRVWVTDLGDGFRLHTLRSERIYRDDEIIDIDVRTWTGTDYRRRSMIERTTRLQLLESPQPLKFVEQIERTDAGLWPLIERLKRHVADLIREAIEIGGVVSGKNWSIDAKELHVRRRYDPIPLAELTAVDHSDGIITLWRRGDVRECLRVKDGSKNAHLLLILLPRLIDENFAVLGESNDSLGPMLYRSKATRGEAISLSFGFVLTLASLSVTGLLLLQGGPHILNVVFAGLSIATILQLLALLSSFRSEFRCHVRGVYCRGLFSDNTLRFDEMASMRFKARPFNVKFLNLGELVTMRFAATVESGKRPLQYKRLVRRDLARLEAARDHVAAVQGRRMLQELSRAGEVRWTPAMRITRQGLAHTRRNRLGAKVERLLPWADCGLYWTDRWNLFVFKKGSQRWWAREPLWEDNFYAGLFVLQSLVKIEGTA